MTGNDRKQAGFVWDALKLKLAEAAAKADRPLNDVLTELGVSERTFYRYKKHPEFQRKIDEIIADIDIAQKAERIKIAKKEIKRILKRLDLNEDKVGSKDLLDWIKFIANETGDYSEQKTLRIIWDDKEDGKEDGTDDQNPI